MRTPIILPLADTRIADKMKNAFGIDLFAMAQAKLETKGIKLQPLADSSAMETYVEKREAPLKKFLPVFALGGIFLFGLLVR